MSIRAFFLAICIPFWGLSQHQTWLGAEFNFKPIKKTKLSLGVQHRMNGFSEWNRTFLEGKFSAKVVSGVHVFAGQRLGICPNPQSSIDLKATTYRYRSAIGIELNPVDWFKEKARFHLGITEQMQWTQRKFQRSNTVLRSKVSAKYDLEDFPLTPFIQWEHFYDFHRDITYMAEEIRIDGGTAAFRTFAGCIVELPKAHELQVSVGRRKNFLRENPQWILAVKYSVNLK